jgi:hypothetical protein
VRQLSNSPEGALKSTRKYYNFRVQRKIFWMLFVILGLAADFILPLWWALFATIPIAFLSWWVAYRSEWF